MCAKCDERCGEEAEAAFWKADDLSVQEQMARVARAVRETGRLSKCPDAVKAGADVVLDALMEPQDSNDEPIARRIVEGMFRAAEDAVLGKE